MKFESFILIYELYYNIMQIYACKSLHYVMIKSENLKGGISSLFDPWRTV